MTLLWLLLIGLILGSALARGRPRNLWFFVLAPLCALAGCAVGGIVGVAISGAMGFISSSGDGVNASGSALEFTVGALLGAVGGLGGALVGTLCGGAAGFLLARWVSSRRSRGGRDGSPEQRPERAG